MNGEEPKLGDWRGFNKWIQEQATTNSQPSNPITPPSFNINSGIPNAPEAKYDAGYMPGSNIDVLRQQNQTAGDVFLNAMSNIATTIPLEMGEGAGYLIGQLFDNESNEFLEAQNKFSTALREQKEALQEGHPIYASKEDQEFNPLNPMSWATNAPSIASTFSLLLPGMGIGGATAKVASNVLRGARLAEKTASRLSKASAMTSAGLSSRYMENMLEGYGTFNEAIIESLKTKGFTDQEAADMSGLLLSDPHAALKSVHKDDFMDAAEKASNTVAWNWGASIVDIMQYGMAFGGIKVPSIIPTRGLSPLASTASFGQKAGRVALKGANAVRSVGTQMASEALEEGYQYIVNQEALNSDEMFGDGFDDRLGSYLAEGEMHSSMLMGAVMGGGFHAGGKAISAIQERLGSAALNEEVAKLYNNYTFLSDAETTRYTNTVRDAYVRSRGNGLDDIISSIEKREAQNDNVDKEKKDSNGRVIDNLKLLNNKVKRLEAEGMEKSQIADYVAYELSSVLRGQAIDSLNGKVDEAADSAVKLRKLNSKDRDVFIAKAKLEAIDKILKKYPEKKRGSIQSKDLLNHLKELEQERTELQEQAKGSIEKSDQYTEAVEAYKSVLFNRLKQTSEARKAQIILKNPAEYLAEKEETQKKAVDKDLNKRVAEIEKAETPEKIIEILQEEEEKVGNTEKSQKKIEEIATKNPISKVALQEGDESVADKLLKEYQSSTEKKTSTFLRDRKYLSDLLGKTLPSNLEEFTKEIARLFKADDVANQVISDYYGNPVGTIKGIKAGKKPDTGTTPDPGDPKDSSHSNSETPKQEDTSIPVVNAQFRWGPPDAFGRRRPYYENEGKGTHYEKARNTNPKADYGLWDNPDFDPTGWEVKVRIDPEDGYNASVDDPKDHAIDVYAVNPKTGEEVFIGNIQAYNNPNIKGITTRFRDRIKKAYEDHLDNNIGVFELDLKMEVSRKEKGDVYILNTENHPENWRSPKEARKGKEVQLFTVIRNSDGTGSWAGLESLSKEHQEAIKSFDVSRHGKNIARQLVGGYMYMLQEATNGEYISVLLFTRPLSEVASEQQKVNEIVDSLYEPGTAVTKRVLLEDIVDLLHINRMTSNIKVSINENGEPEIQRKLDHNVYTDPTPISIEDLKQELANTIFFIDAGLINQPGMNDKYDSYLRTDMNPDYPVHSTSFSIKISKTEKESKKDPKDIEQDNSVEDGDTSFFSNLAAQITATETTETTNESVEETSEAPIDFLDLDLEDDLGTEPIDPVKPMSTVAVGEDTIAEETERLAAILGKKITPEVFGSESDLPNTMEMAKLVANTLSKGEVLQGVFTNAGIYLRKQGIKGRAYHEAFHAIYTLALDNTQRAQVVSEVRDTLQNPLMTEAEVEEYMAELFREEALRSEKETVVSKILKALKALVDHIFNPESKLYHKKLIREGIKGSFRGKVKFQKNISRFANPKAMSGTSGPVSSVLAAEEFMETIQLKYIDLIDKLRFKAPLSKTFDYSLLTDADLLKLAAGDKSGLQYLKDELAKGMISHLQKMQAKGYDTTMYRNILNEYFPIQSRDANNKDAHLIISAKQVGDTFKNEVTVNRVTPPFAMTLLSLRKFGLEVNLATNDLVTRVPEDTTEEDLQADIREDKAHEREGYMRSRTNEDNRDKLRDRVRRSLSTLTKRDLNGAIQYNQFGVNKFENPLLVMSILEQEISNSSSIEAMNDKLNSLKGKYPWAEELLQNIKYEESLTQDLWLGIGGMAFLNFFGVSDKGFTYASNRRSTFNYIKNTLASTFLMSSNPLLNAKDLSINKGAAKKLLEDFQSQKTLLKNALRTNNQDVIDLLIINIADLLQKNHIAIDRETLTRLYREEPEAFFGKVFRAEGSATAEAATNFQNIEGFIMKLESTGMNPFLNYEAVSENNLIVRSLGRLLEDAWPERSQQVFINGEGKRTFALTEPFYLSQKLAQIKENFKDFYDSFAKGHLIHSPLLKDLQNQNTRDTLSMELLDVASIDGKKKTYKSLSKAEMEKVNIDAFLNKRDPRSSLIPIPIPADSALLPFIKVPKLEKEQAIKKLYQVALQEYARIQNLKENPELKNIKHYGKNADKYSYLKFLNKPKYSGLDVGNSKNKGKVVEIIEAELNLEADKTYESLKKSWTFATVDNYGQPYDAPKYSKENVQKFVYNYAYYQSQIISLFAKDPAYYKSIGDAFKRYKELVAPGMTTGKSGTRVKTIVVADELEPASAEYLDKIEKLAYPDETTQSKHAEDNNTTDGFTFVSPKFYREFCKDLGKWSIQQEEVYKEWSQGKPLKKSQLKDLFPPIKPYYFSEYEYAGEMNPMQMKNSMHVLTPEYVKYASSPKLNQVQKFFDEGIDIVTFDSTIKVGLLQASGEVKEDFNPGTDSPYKSLKEIDEAGYEGAVIEINMKDLRWQQDNPSHWFNYEVLFGSQLRALITSGIVENAEYNIGGTTMSGKAVKELYFDLLESLYEDSLSALEGDLNVENGEYGVLMEKMIAMAYDRGLPYSTIKAMEETFTNNKLQEIPNLFGAVSSDLARSLLSSLYRKGVWQQKMPGGQFVNVSSFGIHEKLKYEVTDNGVINMEVLLPAWTKELLQESGKPTSKIDSKVLELIGYRIPTEGKYSVFNMKVVGFLPPSQGGSIIMPKEVTKIAGLDFDIDKLFVFTPNHSYDNKKGVIPSQFDYNAEDKNTQPKAARQNALIEIIRGIMSNVNHAAEALGPGHYADLKNSSQALYLRDLARRNPEEYGKYNMSMEKLRNLPNKEDIISNIQYELYNAIYPLTQAEFHELNTTGEALIGVTANHRTNASKAEETRLELATPIVVEGKEYKYLNRHSGENGLIGKNLEQFSAAMVDNGKDPVAPFINFNVKTADIPMLLIRTGLSIDYALAFLTHPTVVAATQKAIKDDVSLGVAAKRLYRELAGKSISDDTIYDFSQEELETSTDTNNLQVLQNLIIFQQMGAELSSLISATKTDAAPAAGNTGELYVQLVQQEAVLNNEFAYLKYASDFFKKTDTGEVARLSEMTRKYGHLPVHKVFKEFFPYFKDSFMDVKAAIQRELPNGRKLSAKEATMIDDNLVSYWLSGHPSISKVKDKYAFIQDVYDRLLEYKQNANPAYTPFIAQLENVSKELNENYNIDRIEYNRTSLGEEEVENLRTIWWSMWTEGSPQEQALAKDLFRYSILTAGMQNTPFTFLPIAHPNMFNVSTESVEAINEKRIQLVTDNIDFTEKNFIEQFLKNNITFSAIPEIKNPKYNDKNSKEVVAVIQDIHKINRNGDMPMYVRTENGLYEFTNSNKDGVWWYRKTDSLGEPNFFYDYDINDSKPFSRPNPIPNPEGDPTDPAVPSQDLEEKFNSSNTEKQLQLEAFTAMLPDSEWMAAYEHHKNLADKFWKEEVLPRITKVVPKDSMLYQDFEELYNIAMEGSEDPIGDFGKFFMNRYGETSDANKLALEMIDVANEDKHLEDFFLLTAVANAKLEQVKLPTFEDISDEDAENRKKECD